MVTRYKDANGTPIMLGDLVEVNTPTQGYIGEVVFNKDFGQIAVKVIHRRTQRNPERWKIEPGIHNSYLFLESYRHKILGLFKSYRLRPFEVIRRDTDRARRVVA